MTSRVIDLKKMSDKAAAQQVSVGCAVYAQGIGTWPSELRNGAAAVERESPSTSVLIEKTRIAYLYCVNNGYLPWSRVFRNMGTDTGAGRWPLPDESV